MTATSVASVFAPVVSLAADRRAQGSLAVMVALAATLLLGQGEVDAGWCRCGGG